MTYLISQLFLYLICAILLGLLLGWVIWGWWGRRQIAEAKAEAERALLDQQQQFNAEKAELELRLHDKELAIDADQPGIAVKEGTAPKPKSDRFMTDAPKPASLYQSRPSNVDDLQAIHGIGPVMEGILNENGCYHFKQLASFSKCDIEWISAAIHSFPDRIERDRWVEQAQTLHYRKYGQRYDATMSASSKTQASTV